jgi:hypothetical protein
MIAEAAYDRDIHYPNLWTRGLATRRKPLGLSAHDVGLLVGTCSQSVYNW